MATSRSVSPKRSATPVSTLARQSAEREHVGTTATFPTPAPEGTGLELAHSTLASTADLLHLAGVAAEAGADPRAVNRTLQRAAASLTSARGRLDA